jgi:HK97 family phage major capsid protein
MQKIQELLTTGMGTEGSLLIVKTIADNLVNDVIANTIDRKYAAFVFGPTEIQGSSIDINLEDLNSMVVEVTAEGAEIPLGNPNFSSINVKPKKVAIRPQITREMIEDGKFNLIQHSVMRAGYKLAEYESSRIVNALDGATNTVAGGASLTVANITRAMQYLDDARFKPRVYIIGPEVANDIRNLSAFSAAYEYGTNEQQMRGLIGKIFGMDVVLVSTGGLTGYTSTTSYVLDPQYGFAIAEKRPVTMETFSDTIHDMEGVVVSQRIEAVTIRAPAIAKITTT